MTNIWTNFRILEELKKDREFLIESEIDIECRGIYKRIPQDSIEASFFEILQHNYGEIEGLPYMLYSQEGYLIFKDYFDKTSLKNCINEEIYLSTEDLMAIFSDCLNVLKKIHKSGIVHDGISPENILINNKQVMIINFEEAVQSTDPKDHMYDIWNIMLSFVRYFDNINWDKIDVSLENNLNYSSYINSLKEQNSDYSDFLDVLSFVCKFINSINEDNILNYMKNSS